jgi:hypothetical protein
MVLVPVAQVDLIADRAYIIHRQFGADPRFAPVMRGIFLYNAPIAATLTANFEGTEVIPPVVGDVTNYFANINGVAPRWTFWEDVTEPSSITSPSSISTVLNASTATAHLLRARQITKSFMRPSITRASSPTTKTTASTVSSRRHRKRGSSQKMRSYMKRRTLKKMHRYRGKR